MFNFRWINFRWINFRWMLCSSSIALASIAIAPAGEPGSSIPLGKQLFERDWRIHPPAQGDGIGPLFNDVSCVACHNQGGVGGAGGLDHNVRVVSLGTSTVSGVQSLSQSLTSALQQLHPAFVSADGSIVPVFVFHRRSTSSQYEPLRSRFLQAAGVLDDGSLAATSIARKPIDSGRFDPHVPGTASLAFHLEQRNTTPLFGLGLIDRVPDEVILAQQRRQSARGGAVSGRVADIDGSLAKFGWRLQVPTLFEFISEACAVEMGMQTPDHPQGVDPLQPGYDSQTADMTTEEVQALTDFVSALPAPRQQMPLDPQMRAMVAAGQQLFNRVGCAQCHVRSMPPALDIYSDLLLHDMGQLLESPIPAPPFIVKRERVQLSESEMASRNGGVLSPGTKGFIPSVRSSGYYSSSAATLSSSDVPPRIIYQSVSLGPIVSSGANNQPQRMINAIKETIEPTFIKREWRTPPLWGVADSAPYLHDGRAATLLEAIAMHGGEAEASRDAFLSLPVEQQQAVVAFLETLVAPPMHPLTSAIAMR